MKHITELSEQEILALTNEQIEKMIKFKMAEDGIRILTMPVEPEYEPMPEKTEKYYSLIGFTYLTKDQDFANKLSEVVKSHSAKLVNYGYVGSDYRSKKIRFLENHEKDSIGQVTVESYFSPEQAYEAGQIADRNAILKKDYEVALKEFKSNEEQADYIRVEIWSRVKEVTKKYQNMQELKEQYLRYIDLADGNKKVAMNFLKKAYVVDEEIECFVQDKPYEPVTADEPGHIN